MSGRAKNITIHPNTTFIYENTIIYNTKITIYEFKIRARKTANKESNVTHAQECPVQFLGALLECSSETKETYDVAKTEDVQAVCCRLRRLFATPLSLLRFPTQLVLPLHPPSPSHPLYIVLLSSCKFNPTFTSPSLT